MPDFSPETWRVYVAPLPEPERRQAMRDLSDRKHRIIGPTGRPLDFSGGPTKSTTALPPPVIERKALVPHHRSPASTETRHEPIQAETPSNGGLPRLSPDDKRGFDAFIKSFEQLPPAERAKATQKLVETYIPRLIHD